MKQETFAHAWSFPDEDDKRCTVRFEGVPPDFKDGAEGAAWFEGEASRLAGLLYETLPGGTLDHLCGLLIQQQATLYTRSYGTIMPHPLPGEET